MSKSIITLAVEAVVNGQRQVVQMSADVKALGKAAQAAGASSNVMRDSFGLMAVKIGAACTAINQITQAFGSFTSQVRSFDTAMRSVNTMAGASAQEMERLKEQVTGLSKVIPLTRDELAGGLYQVISNGVPENNWLTFLEQSARAAVGGIADLNGVVTVTSTVIKNYGLAWEDAAAIQDKIQTTAKLGVTSFEQLQQALPSVTGNAATLGVTIDELLATFATLTGVSGNTSEVATQLGAIFTALSKPSAKATKVAAEMGFAFNAAAIKAAGGFRAFLADLDKSVKAYSRTSGMLEQEVYARLFGSAESLRALIPLQGELADSFAEKTEQMTNSAGEIGRAFDSMAGGMAGAAQIRENQLTALTDALAKPLVPLGPLLAKLGEVGMASMGISATATAVRTLGASARTAFTAVGKLSQGVTATKVASSSCGAALAGMGAVIASLVAGVALIIKAMDTLSRGFDETTARANATAAAHKAYARTVAEAKGAVEAEATALSAMMDVARSENQLMENRKANVDALNSKIHGLNATIDASTGKLRFNVEAWEQHKQALYNDALMAGFQAQITQIASRKAELTLQHAEAVREAEAAQRDALAAAQGNPFANVSGGGGGGRGFYSSMAAGANVAARQGRVNSILQEIANADAQLALFQREMAKIPSALAGLATGATDAVITADTSAGVAGASGASGRGHSSTAASPEWVWDGTRQALDSYAHIEAALSQLRDKRQKAAVQDVANWDAQIAAVERYRRQFDLMVQGLSAAQAYAIANAPALNLPTRDAAAYTYGGDPTQLRTLQEISQAIDYCAEQREAADRREIAAWNQKLSALESYREQLMTMGQESKKLNLDHFTKAWSGLKGGVNTIEQTVQTLTSSNNAWKKASAVIDGVIGTYQNFIQTIQTVQSVMEILNTLKATTAAVDTAATAAEVQNTTSRVAATRAETTANVADASSGVMKAHAAIPFVGIAIAAGLIATLLGIMGSLPKFAKGGIAYGPTLGLFGEYAGASNNPEVVAPLDRLRSLIGPTSGLPKEIKIRGRGRDLYGVICTESKLRNRRHG